MTTQPTMTDLSALDRYRARATTAGLFLHEAAADDLQDRLGMVNKSFHEGVVISGFPDFWGKHFPGFTMQPVQETLTLEPASHDLLVHAMALHWANDPVGQLIQCRRALRPDGLMLAVAFGGQTLTELRACLGQAETAERGGLSPRVAPMADLRDMGALLQRAGFALPVADSVTMKVEYTDAWHLMRDLRAMGETNALEGRLRHPTARSVFAHAAELYQSHFGTGSGRITATFELVFLAGWAPDASQQQPLRPGSARRSLAQALSTDETKLPN